MILKYSLITFTLITMGVASVATTSTKDVLAVSIASKDLPPDGKEIYLNKCASCHHPTRDLTGPHFYNVRARWKDKNLLYKFVRNSKPIIKKDAYAKKLFEKWYKSVMTPFPLLSNAQIDAVFDYIDGEAKKKGLMN